MKFRPFLAAAFESWLSRLGSPILGPGLTMLFIVLLPLLSLQSLAAPTISPALIEQAKRMSPAQRQDLAKQYGIPLGTIAAPGSTGVEERAPQEALQRPREFSDAGAVSGERQSLEDDQVPRFGERLFSMDGSMYEPPSSSAVPQNYLLGPGDRLSVTLFGKVSARYEVIVEQDGSLVVPELGPISVSGLTFLELKELVSRVSVNA